MVRLVTNQQDIVELSPILRDRIWRDDDGMLQVDTYPHTFDGDVFDYDDWDVCQVYICGSFKEAYHAARLLLRRLGLTPDQEAANGI